MELRMSSKERDRLKVLAQMDAGLMTQIKAAELLGITPRQVRRLAARRAASGDAGLVHAARGRRGNRRIPAEDEERAKAALAGVYADFGPTLACEKLAEREGIGVSRETVRLWMRGLALEGGRRKPRPHRRRRPRRSCFGELVQIDTSDHEWLEGRGPRLWLVTMIDDATGFKLARFFSGDGVEPNMTVLKLWMERMGRPVALYSDHAGHFRQVEIAGRLTPQTQIERALASLDVRLIIAHSPQAKGRVERSHGTDQDRLVKELRLEGISTAERANEFLEKVYLPRINAKFSVPAADLADAHRTLEGFDLEAILSRQETRTVALDWTVQIDGVAWQLEGGAIKGMPPRAKVTLERRLDGTNRIRWGDRYLSYRSAPQRPFRAGLRVADDGEDFDEKRTADEKKTETAERAEASAPPTGAGGRRGFAPPPPRPR